MKNKIIITLIVILGLGGLTYYKTLPTPKEISIPVDNRKYKDGTYSSTGSYTSPAGTENVEVTLVIQNDKVISVVFAGKATNKTSIKLQDMFKAGFSQVVVGKNIDEVNLTVVNGSSLTPKGFMEALIKIKAEAKA